MSTDPTTATGTRAEIRRIEDLPVFSEIESPEFGADLDWISDDLCQRDYQGLLRHDNLGVVVYRNADLIALGTHEDVSHQDVLNDVEGLQDRFMQASTFGMQPPEHRPAKSLISKQLTPKSVRRFEDAANQAVRGALESAAGRPEIDFVPEFVHPVLAGFWQTVLGLKPSETDEIFAILPDFFLPFSLVATEEDLAAATRAADRFIDLITPALEREMSTGRHDVLVELASDYANMGELGRPENLCTHFGVALPDAFNTAGAAAANNVLGLWSNPESHAMVKRTPALVESAWFEGTRFHSPVLATMRAALRDFDYNGLLIPAGTPLAMLWAFGNRDPETYDQPNEYRLERDHRALQTTFGTGFYTCPGRHVAKLISETILSALCDSSLDVVVNDVEWGRASFVHEPARMTVSIRES